MVGSLDLLVKVNQYIIKNLKKNNIQHIHDFNPGKLHFPSLPFPSLFPFFLFPYLPPHFGGGHLFTLLFNIQSN